MNVEEAIGRHYACVVAEWRERLPKTRVDLASTLCDYRIYFAYNSGRIENAAITYHDTREIFENGNGRVGRALMNHLLVMNEHPPIIIYDEDKLAYYGAIQVWGDEGELAPMVKFLCAETVKTWSAASCGTTPYHPSET